MNDFQYDTDERRISGFAKRYLIFLAVALVLVIAVLIFLWFKLDNYQKEADNEVASDTQALSGISEGFGIESDLEAQQYFENYINSLSTADWIGIYRQSHPESLDSDENIEAFVNETILPALSSRYRCSDYSSSSPRFMIGTGSNVIASFILAPKDGSWEISEAKILTAGSGTLTVTAAKNCEIRINGTELYSDSLTLADISESTAELQDYTPDLTNPVIFNTCTVTGLLDSNPTVESGNSYLSEDGIYYETVEDTDGLLSQAKSFVEAMLNCYAQGKNNIDGNLSKALAYVDSSSSAAKIIRETKSGLEWTPPDSSISLNTTCSPLCILADNCRFAEVFCESGNIYKVYFLDRQKGYKIVLFSVK